MKIGQEDDVFMNNVYMAKRYDRRTVLIEFETTDRLLNKVCTTGKTNDQPDSSGARVSGRPTTAAPSAQSGKQVKNIAVSSVNFA